MRPTDRPYEKRLQMALEAALERSGSDRDAFVNWLMAADPKMAADVIFRLSAQRDSGTPDGD